MLGRDGPAAKPAGYLNEARLRGLLAEGFVPDPLVKVHKSRATGERSPPSRTGRESTRLFLGRLRGEALLFVGRMFRYRWVGLVVEIIWLLSPSYRTMCIGP